MTPINAALVKTLRERTGAGVIDCRKALIETDGDLDAATDRLRAAEIAKAAAKVDRVAAEGLVGLVVTGTTGAIAELNTETDFVARTESFRQAAAAFAGIALEVQGDHGRLLTAPSPDGDGAVSDMLARLSARTGERVNLRRAAFVAVSPGVVASYVHNAGGPGVGGIGVLVALESRGTEAALLAIGRKIAMHVAATAPLWVSLEDIPAEVVTQKRAELTEQAGQAGKPPQIVQKMVEGRMRRFYEEVVLGLQPFVLNPEQRVAEALKDAEPAAGAPIAIKAFARFRIGEGIEKRVDMNEVRRAATR
ncbi:MAG: translation elongation factor Ts [Acidobacteriota bacterium]